MSEQLIPNAVGRLDDVVEALAAGDVLKASNLLWKRGNDINRKRSIAAREYDKANHELSAVMDFSERLGADRDFAERVRAACGAGGGREVDVKNLPKTPCVSCTY